VHKRIISAVKRVEFVNDRMSYKMLRGCWRDIIVLNIHAPTEDKTLNVKNNIYDKLEHVLDKFPKYHLKILLLVDLNAKIGRENIFEPTIGNENVHKISNNNGATVINFVTSRNLTA
jgi:hypothetical protein